MNNKFYSAIAAATIVMFIFPIALISNCAYADDGLMVGIELNNDTEVLLQHELFGVEGDQHTEFVDVETVTYGDILEGDEKSEKWLDSKIKNIDGATYFGRSVHEIPDSNMVAVHYYYYNDVDWWPKEEIINSMNSSIMFETNEYSNEIEEALNNLETIDQDAEVVESDEASFSTTEDMDKHRNDDIQNQENEQQNNVLPVVAIIIVAVVCVPAIAFFVRLSRRS